MFGCQVSRKSTPVTSLEIAAKGAHLIDVRTEAEVAQGVIDGAIHIPLHLLPLRATDIRRTSRWSSTAVPVHVRPGLCVHGLQGL
jgi:rhodanese-related sulfurtransferase